MIEILNQVFKEVLVQNDCTSIGNIVYIKLDENRRVEVSFYNTWSADSFDSMKLQLFHKENGILNTQIVRFKDLFTSIQDLTHPNQIGKHIWYSNNMYNWYGKPDLEDLDRMKNTLINYIDLWK